MVEHKGVYLSLEAYLSLPQTSEQNQKPLHHHPCENGEVKMVKQNGARRSVSSQTFWKLRPGKLPGGDWSVSHIPGTE